MPDRLIFNDSTEIAGHASESEGTLWVYIDKATLAEGYEILSSPWKTARIVHVFGESRTEYEGYTYLFCISEKYGGGLSAGLKRRNYA